MSRALDRIVGAPRAGSAAVPVRRSPRRRAARIVPGAAAAMLALSLVHPAAAQGFAWSEGRSTPAEAAQLFESACLARLPDFAGADALLSQLGFVRHPTMLMQNHAGKNMSAMAMTGNQTDAGGARSCAIMAEGFDQNAVEQAIEPIIARRFGDTASRFENPAIEVDHVVWVGEADRNAIRIIVTENDGSAFLGVTVLPRNAGARQ